MAMGARSHEVLLIDSGAVKVLLPSAAGLDVVVGLRGPGTLLGELGVLDEQPRSATVVGFADGVATHLPGPAFRDLVDHDRDVRRLTDDARHQRLRSADRRQVQVATMNVRSRTICQLLDWAMSFGERTVEGVVLSGLSHRDLAGAVLASEKHVDAVLHELRRAGLLRTSRLRFVLPEPDRLGQFVDEP